MALLAEAGADTDADPVAVWLGKVVRGEPAGPAARRRAAPRRCRAAADVRQRGPRRCRRAPARAGVPLHSRGIDEGTALHYAGMWGRGSTVELLLARGAEPNLMAGPPEHPGNALGWTAWGSRALDGDGERVEGYVAAARALLAAGASATRRHGRDGRGRRRRAARGGRAARRAPVRDRPGARARALPRRPLRDRRPRLGGRRRPAGRRAGSRSPSARSRSCGWNVGRNGRCSSAPPPTATSRRPRAPDRGRSARGARRAARDGGLEARRVEPAPCTAGRPPRYGTSGRSSASAASRPASSPARTTSGSDSSRDTRGESAGGRMPRIASWPSSSASSAARRAGRSR